MENIITSGQSSRFVVTHGTDTMVETAQFVDLVCVSNGAVAIFVGSKLPEAFKGTDANFVSISSNLLLNHNISN
jgi:L-asparaginase/Glu-tRNA(Gln) amidotransferase subunit D